MLRDTTGTREQQKGLLYLCAKILKKPREFHSLYKKMQIRLPVVRLSADLLSYIYMVYMLRWQLHRIADHHYIVSLIKLTKSPLFQKLIVEPSLLFFQYHH